MPKDLTHADAIAYARAVGDRSISMGRWVTLACDRFLGDLERAKDPAWPYYFDSGRVDQILTLAGQFRHFKGEYAGEPFRPSPWQAFIVANLFGFWYRPGYLLDGKPVRQGQRIRRFGESYVMVGRGNGKTFFASWLGLVSMATDGEAGAEFFNGANTESQALICFRSAVKLAQSCPRIAKHLHAQVGDFTWRDATWVNLHSNAGALDGSMPYFVILDESHEMARPDLYEVMMTGMAKRGMRGHMMLITTAGLTDDETHFGMMQYNMALTMLEPEKHGVSHDVADRFFAYVAQLDDGDDVYDSALWIKANPNLGVSVSAERIRTLGEQARGDRGKFSSFVAKHCCKWSQKTVTWLDMEAWHACPVYSSELRGQRCILGVDIGLTGDLSAIVAVFFDLPDTDDRELVIRADLILPGDDIGKKSRIDRVPYQEYAAEGFLHLTPGSVTDFDFLKSWIVTLRDQYTVEAIAYDRAHMAQLAGELESMGFDMFNVPQGLPLNEAIRRTEELVISHRIREAGRKNPLMAAHAKNADIKVNHDGRAQLAKGGKIRHRIDGIAALVNAVDHMIKHPPSRRSATRPALSVPRTYKGSGSASTWKTHSHGSAGSIWRKG